MNAIGTFVALLLLARDVAHREHWKTKSYAQHMALGEFYSQIADLADTLVESYQGKHGIIDDIPLLQAKDGAIAKVLRDQMEWIEARRYEAVTRSDTALQNIVDEIVGLYQRTLYKLDNLK